MSAVDPHPPRRDPSAAVPYPVQVSAALCWRFLVIAAALTVIGYVVITLRLVFVPLAIGVLLTALLAPLVSALVRARAPRWLAATVVLVVGLATVGGVLSFVVQAFIDGLPELTAQVNETITGLERYLRDPPFGLPPVEVSALLDQATTALSENRSQLTSGVLATAYTLADFLTGMVLAIFIVIIFLYQGDSTWRFLLRGVPDYIRPKVDLAGQRGFAALVGFVRATFLVAVVDAVGIGIGLVAVSAPLVVPLTALVFLSAFIPIAGAVLSGILAVLVVLVANGPVAALIVLAVVLGVQQLEGNILQPLIMGRAVALDALAVVLAVTIGTVLAGITGALLSVPLLAVLNAAIRSLVNDDRSVDPDAVDPNDPRAAVPAGQPGSVEAHEAAKADKTENTEKAEKTEKAGKAAGQDPEDG